MSWGHAVSTDLATWTELPVAIEYTAAEAVYSGSAVLDALNSSGLGAPGRPAIVAVYTSVDAESGLQRQTLAFSTDRGQTFTRHGDAGSGRRFHGLPRPEGVLAHGVRVLGNGGRAEPRAPDPGVPVDGPARLGASVRLRAHRCHGRCVGVPGPVPARRRGRARGVGLGAPGQPRRRGRRRRLRHPVLRRRLRRHHVHGPPPRLARPRSGQLRGGDIQRRPRRTTDPDRLDVQLGLRRHHSDPPLAGGDDRAPRADPAPGRRPAGPRAAARRRPARRAAPRRGVRR